MSFYGTYDRTIYKNRDDGFCIISLKSSDTSIPPKARSSYKHNDHLIRFTATGYSLPETDTVEIKLDGDWETSKYGCQLKVSAWEAVVPQTKKGIREYLASGLIKGLDARMATEIVEKFGVNALYVIEHEPERLLEIPGISPTALEAINTSCKKSRTIQALKDFLAPFKVSAKSVVKIYECLGPESMEIVKRSPFELCRVPGFGFKSVDAIARKVNCHPDDPLRIRGALFFVLDKCSAREGHLYVDRDELCKMALQMLNLPIPRPEQRLQLRDVAEVLYRLVQKKELIAEDSAVYLPRHYRNEFTVARHIAASLASPSRGLDITLALEKAKRTLGITPSKRQEEAVVMAFRRNPSIISGAPGTGKTTVLKLLIAVFQMLNPDARILLTAPTGRASRRMSESTGHPEAKTLHSALGLLTNDEENGHMNSHDPVEADLLIIDEVSMVDMWLGKELFSRINRGTLVVLVGDPDQLPSVAPGNVFREMIDCGLIPVTQLDEIFRQAKGSLIPENARRINDNLVTLEVGDDFIIKEVNNAKEAVAYITEVYLREIADLGVARVQILSPYASEGVASAKELNLLIRDLVNPPAEDKAEVRVGTKLFREKDRIMQTKNKNGISNGDIGFVHAIRDPRGLDATVVLRFSGDRVVEYDPSELGIIELSYAMTVHKAMGSEYDVVIMPVLWDHRKLLGRNLIYTGVTRAIKRCYLAGQSHALINGIHRDKIGERNTRLGFRIKCQYAKLLTQRAESAGSQQLRFTG